MEVCRKEQSCSCCACSPIDLCRVRRVCDVCRVCMCLSILVIYVSMHVFYVCSRTSELWYVGTYVGRQAVSMYSVYLWFSAAGCIG